MRAWINRDITALKAVTARDFTLVVGSKPPVMLDYLSFIDAADQRWACSSYRFGTVYVRAHGSFTLFAAQADLEARFDRTDWSGPVWITDLWRKGKVRRRWRLVERVISRPEDRAEVPPAIRGMQLWR